MSGGLGGWSRTTPSTSFLNAMRSAIVHRMIFLDVRCISEAAVYREFRNSFSGKLLRNSTSLVRGINGLYLSQNDEFHRRGTSLLGWSCVYQMDLVEPSFQ